MSEFADTVSREGTGYPNAAKAIEAKSGVTVSPVQIHSRIGKMWDRYRLHQFRHYGSSFSQVFDVGPSCFDLERLNVVGEQKAGGEYGLGVKKAYKRDVGRKDEQNRTTLVQTRAFLDRSSKNAYPMTTSEAKSERDNLRERVEALSIENQALRTELNNLESMNLVQKQLSSMKLEEQGPRDNEVLDTMDEIEYLVQQSCRYYRDESRTCTMGPSFAEMEQRFPQLYTLNQQVYALDDAEENQLSTLRLASLGISDVDDAKMLRALAGMAVLQQGLDSSFPPELFYDRGQVASTYERVIRDHCKLSR